MGRFMRNCVLGIVAAAASAFAAVAADRGPVVVELYTSQGCNSCPPADEYLGRIADRDDVIALSLHVDYWDYLGWRDVFGDPAHSRRQRAYAAHMGERMVYTPQVVVHGQEAMVGSRAVQVDEAIARVSETPDAAAVALSLRGDRLVAEIAPTDKDAVGAERARGEVRLVWWSRAEEVAIRSGENRGKRIVYHNVVKGWSDLGNWRGARIAMTTPKPMGADGVAVIVQKVAGGPIIGAGRLLLNP